MSARFLWHTSDVAFCQINLAPVHPQQCSLLISMRPKFLAEQDVSVSEVIGVFAANKTRQFIREQFTQLSSV